MSPMTRPARSHQPQQRQWRPGDFPLPQLTPDHGEMKLPPGYELPKGVGRCRACGMHVETQLHRTYCPNTGKDAATIERENRAYYQQQGDT